MMARNPGPVQRRPDRNPGGRSRRRMPSRGLPVLVMAVAVLVALALLVAGCGSSGTTGNETSPGQVTGNVTHEDVQATVGAVATVINRVSKL